MPLSFKDVTKIVEDTQPEATISQPNTSNAATKILAAHAIKDKRLTFRINSSMYDQFTTINRKLGAASGSVINLLISGYIRDHKDLLD